MDYDKLPMVLTPKDVGAVLGLPPNQVYRLFNSKKFPSTKISGKHIITRPKFLRWLGIEPYREVGIYGKADLS